MKILVTGATGFIGQQVVREALCRGHHIIAVSRSLPTKTQDDVPGVRHIQCDLANVFELKLKSLSIDAVVHLAASLYGSAESQFRNTVIGTGNLLDAMQKAGVSKLVGMSSLAVVDYVAAAPMSVIDENLPPYGDDRTMSTYASVKLRQERLFSAFAAKPGTRCVILRPGLVYDENRLINAHAGIAKGAACVLVRHGGDVPVVSVKGVARAVLDAIEQNFPTGHVIHLVDDRLPNHGAYLKGLRRRNLLPPAGIGIPWQLMACLTTATYRMATAAGLKNRLPGMLLPHSFASRMKPFRYANDKAKQLLGWTPDQGFC